jgi:23S rRNA (uridine2552-2'-O)-methyltransferase
MSSGYNRQDHWYKEAKESGYRSRASFKLRELDDRFKFLSRGAAVLDLGAWPGGWLQVASERVGSRGVVVGVDLVEIEPIADNVTAITGDVRDDEIFARFRDVAPEGYSVVMSDMSPKLTGIRELDAMATTACAELAFWVAEQLLHSGGVFLAKVFKSNEAQQFIQGIRPRFSKVQRVELDTTRKSSNEFYCVGLGFKK